MCVCMCVCIYCNKLKFYYIDTHKYQRFIMPLPKNKKKKARQVAESIYIIDNSWNSAQN